MCCCVCADEDGDGEWRRIRNKQEASAKQRKDMGVKGCAQKSERLSMTFPLWLQRHIVTSGPPASPALDFSARRLFCSLSVDAQGTNVNTWLGEITRAKSARLRLIARIWAERIEMKGSIIEKK